jgi:hypothetical protein
MTDVGTRLIGQLFAQRGGAAADPRAVAARARARMGPYPRARAQAQRLATRSRRPSWRTIEQLALELERESQDHPRRTQDLVEALIWGARSRMPRGLHTRLPCWFCWRPGRPGRVDGHAAVLCSEHAAHRPEGRRLITMIRTAGGAGELRDEVRRERQHVRDERDYAALAAMRAAHRHIPDWRRVEQEHGWNDFDDALPIFALAWENVVRRYLCVVAGRRRTAGALGGRPRHRDARLVTRARKLMVTGQNLQQAAAAVGMSAPTLSRRLRK